MSDPDLVSRVKCRSGGKYQTGRTGIWSRWISHCFPWMLFGQNRDAESRQSRTKAVYVALGVQLLRGEALRFWGYGLP